MERVKSIFSLPNPSYVLAPILNSFASSVANEEEISLAGERNRAAICHRPSMATRTRGRDLPKIPIGGSSISFWLQIKAN